MGCGGHWGLWLPGRRFKTSEQALIRGVAHPSQATLGSRDLELPSVFLAVRDRTFGREHGRPCSLAGGICGPFCGKW